MKAIISFVLLSLMVAANKDVMGIEIKQSSTIWQWFQLMGLVPNAPPHDCDGDDTIGQKVTDLQDCHNFYLCIGDGMMTPDSYACTDYDDICFDPDEGECSNNQTLCDIVCGISNHACSTTCTENMQQVADMDNCGRRYFCLEDADEGIYDKIPVDCETDRPYFDGHHCGTDKSACCNCQLDRCISVGDFIADPMDCHKYYTCTRIDEELKPFGPIPCDGSGSFVNGVCDPATTECTSACDQGESTTLKPTIPTPGCQDINDFPCTAKGYFARCTYCDPSYFHCSDVGASPKQGECPQGMLFNPTPDYTHCVQSDECPIA